MVELIFLVNKLEMFDENLYFYSKHNGSSVNCGQTEDKRVCLCQFSSFVEIKSNCRGDK
jgi:hypothetical protein